MEPGNGISVIICCYNSSLRLPQTLKHLALQQVPKEIGWEIIVVNNAYADNTADVAKNEWLKYNLRDIILKIEDEPKPGLSNAREKGIQSSKYDYIIFCDDDNWLDENYLVTAYNIISKNSNIAALGGQSTATSTNDFPGWFESSKHDYAVGQQAAESGDVTWRQFLWGSGITIRKDVYKSAFLNFPSLLTGRKGKELSSGEDSEMCIRFILMGYRLYYSEQLKFTHFIAQERLNITYYDNMVKGFVKAYETLSLYRKFIDAREMGLIRKYSSFLKSVLKMFIISTTHVKRWNVYIENLNIYIISGLQFKTLDKEIVNIKRLTTN